MDFVILLQSEILEVPDTLSLVKSLQDQVQNLTWANTLSRVQVEFLLLLCLLLLFSLVMLYFYMRRRQKG